MNRSYLKKYIKGQSKLNYSKSTIKEGVLRKIANAVSGAANAVRGAAYVKEKAEPEKINATIRIENINTIWNRILSELDDMTKLFTSLSNEINGLKKSYIISGMNEEFDKSIEFLRITLGFLPGDNTGIFVSEAKYNEVLTDTKNAIVYLTKIIKTFNPENINDRNYEYISMPKDYDPANNKPTKRINKKK